MTKADKAPEPRPALYIGRRLEGKRMKLVRMFKPVEPDDDGNRTEFYYPKALARKFEGAQIGRAYDMSEGVPSFWHKARTPEHDPDEKALIQYQALDRDSALKKQEMKNDPAPELERALAQIRVARAALSPFKRQAFDLWALSQIQK